MAGAKCDLRRGRFSLFGDFSLWVRAGTID